MKTAIVILSDPESNSGEAAARMINGLAVAYDAKTAGEEVTVLFHGPGTRWPKVLSDQTHPGHAMFKAVEDQVAGCSAVCATHFKADTAGFKLIEENMAPNPYGKGLPSLHRLRKQGYDILTF